ncbi:MAG: spermidine synthase [Thiomicrorhabdus sp.]|nr:MAG: spermidine synthase [Thiomicrorhabdus sp.]
MIPPLSKIDKQPKTLKQKHGGDLIHCQRDEFGLLEVIDTPSMRSLYFDSPVEQSRLYFHAPMSLSFEYQKVIEAQILQRHQQKPVQRLLMLGMGGGSIASHLNALEPEMQIHIVELRQAVIDIAYEFFHLPEEPEIEVMQEDALIYIDEALSEYDVIIVDVFDDSGLPGPFTADAFQQNLLRNLKPAGLVLFNLWAHQDTHTKQQTDQIIDYWQNIQEKQSKTTIKTYPIQSSENIILSIQI